MTHVMRNAALVGVLMGSPLIACAQSLEQQVASAPDGSVQFHFASREGTCGNGRNYLHVDDDGWHGSFNSDGLRNDPCLAGPARVVIVRAGREVVKIEAYVGPLFADPVGGKDLGAVSGREAANYLLSLATSLDGRPAREAIMPAMLADSAIVTPNLLKIARDQARSRELRRTAISWFARRRSEAGGVGVNAVAQALDKIVRDRTESEPIREQALSTISRFDRGEGIPTLLGFAADADPWIARKAFATVSRSGDPRARKYMRDAIKRTDLPEESMTEAIRGLGGEYATSADVAMLRDLYPTLSTDRLREAVLGTLASAGGTDNANWLLGIAKSPTEPASRRRRAVALLSKYDDPRIKDALKEMIDR